jgi:hypothetical protein
VFVNPDKLFEGAVISLFRLFGEATAGQFLHAEVIAEAFAAEPLPFTRGIAADAGGHIS